MAEATGRPFKLIVGLGNPGRKYAATRHNVGFVVAERLAEREGARWGREKKWDADLAKGSSCYYLKPQTFMNLSGRAVAGVANFLKIAPAEILVIFDDVDLPLGTLRFRATGSAGGHNGIKSIIAALGTEDFGRLKIGVGRSAESRMDLVDHVLGKFEADEMPLLEKSLDRAVDAVNDASSRGLEAAMTEYNQKPKPPSPPEKKPPEAREQDDRSDRL